MKPFGAVCYVYIPPEKRAKLDTVRERARLIGYADDDDTEEMAGYKVLLESSMTSLYSNDVKFSDEPITALEAGGEIDESFFGRDGDYEEPEEDADVNENDSEDEEYHTPLQSPIAQRTRSQQIESEYDDTSEEELNDTSDEEYIENMAKLILATRLTKNELPVTEQDARLSKDWLKWEKAINAEYQAMKEKQVWTEEVDELPEGVKAVMSRWVFTTKDQETLELLYKARLVAKGFTEKYGIDYDEVFAPVSKFKSIRTTIAVAAKKGWKVWQDDVKTAFLNADLTIPKWVKLPNGKFAYVKKALYGLKESPREWFNMFNSFMMKCGFTQSQADMCIFFKENIIVGLYVDDILTTGEIKEVQDFREKLKSAFKLNEKGGLASTYLGIKITQSEEKITLDQRKYVEDKLDEYREFIGDHRCCATPLPPDFQSMLLEAENSNETEPTFPYRSMVGSLVYAMMGTRFDISAAVSVVSKYCERPKKIHCDMVRRIYWYLRGNNNRGIIYDKGSVELIGYCDSSYANLENYASLSGYVYKFGGGAISWGSSRQKVIATSTSEAEYVALLPCLQECVWLKLLLKELGYQQGVVSVMEDNEACLALAKNPQNHSRTRHIQVRYHWIRQAIADGVAKLVGIKTKNQLADLFTKGLHGPQTRYLMEELGMKRLPNQGEK